MSKLADRLQGMPTSDQQTAAGGARSRNEIYQFIDTLKNMQVAVSRTVNEQARVKKSRALVVLLNMFERCGEIGSTVLFLCIRPTNVTRIPEVYWTRDKVDSPRWIL